MKKLSTLFKKDPNDLGRVINKVNPENEWVFTDEGVKATRKYDGTACAIIHGNLYKRYDVKKGRQVPELAIPCEESPDQITGHWPHWIPCKRDEPADKFHWQAYDLVEGDLDDGTYELCGPKIQGNPEKFSSHVLVLHGDFDLHLTTNIYDFNAFKEYLKNVDIEGIVFHHPDGRMCKLRKSDYGIKR
jgi:hypothetical protein